MKTIKISLLALGLFLAGCQHVAPTSSDDMMAEEMIEATMPLDEELEAEEGLFDLDLFDMDDDEDDMDDYDDEDDDDDDAEEVIENLEEVVEAEEDLDEDLDELSNLDF